MGRHPLADWLDAGDAAPPEDGDASGGDASDELGDASKARRRWPVLVAAVVPWVVLLAVLARAGDDDPANAGDDEPASARAGDDEPASDPPILEHIDDDSSEPAVPEHGVAHSEHAPPEQPPADMAAAAAVAVRMDVTRSAQDGEPARYVDLVAPESVERRGDLWVVRVLAVVLEGGGERWETTHLRHLAVPLRRDESDGRAQVVGRPWTLPEEPAETADHLLWTPVDDLDEEVADALTAAGFARVEDLEVERAESVLRAGFTGGDPPETQRVWLSDEPLPRVLGARPHPLEPAR